MDLQPSEHTRACYSLYHPKLIPSFSDPSMRLRPSPSPRTRTRIPTTILRAQPRTAHRSRGRARKHAEKYKPIRPDSIDARSTKVTRCMQRERQADTGSSRSFTPEITKSLGTTTPLNNLPRIVFGAPTAKPMGSTASIPHEAPSTVVHTAPHQSTQTLLQDKYLIKGGLAFSVSILGNLQITLHSCHRNSTTATTHRHMTASQGNSTARHYHPPLHFCST